MLGILNQPDILTRTIGSDTPIDCLRKAFNDLRVGTAFAKANLVLTHPTTWAEVQLQNSEGGLYLKYLGNVRRAGRKCHGSVLC